MWSKTKVGLTLGALVLAFSVGNVFAQETTQSATEGKQAAKMFEMFKGHKGMHGVHHGKGMAPWENQELLTLLSLDATALQTEFQAGKSLADIAKAKGVAVEKVVELLVKQHEAQLETAVKDGKLTQEQATQMKEKMTERITDMVNNTHPKGFKDVKMWGHGFKDNKELFDLLKLDAEKLQTELKAGKSLAEIAKAQGIAVEKVVELLVKQHEAQLETAVKDGKLTQEQATKMKEKMTERVTSMVNNTHPKGDGIGKGWGKGHGLWNDAELLALLKLDAEKLQTELKAGKSLAEIAAAQGVTKEVLSQFLTKQFESKLDEAVKAGKITQEKATTIKEKQKEFIEKLIEKKFTPKTEKIVTGQ
ncbi:hypothetical protein [Brevibacillus sp. SYSU BS000544]|uniref:hypothetical protein n=1 Tax=Brevibacillus sp. SYSU BS000544 TaxID=3416443 RepID=UPI003CE59080